MTISIAASVAQRLAGTSTQVMDIIVDGLVQVEIHKRAESAKAALLELDKLTIKLRSVSSPDQKLFDAGGTVVNEYFTKGRLDEIKKLNEKIAKIDGCLKSAFEDNDFKKLFELKIEPEKSDKPSPPA